MYILKRKTPTIILTSIPVLFMLKLSMNVSAVIVITNESYVESRFTPAPVLVDKKPAMRLCAWPVFHSLTALFADLVLDQVDQCVHGLLLIDTVRDQRNGSALHDTQAQHAQQALGVYAALILLHPNAALELIGLLNEIGGGSGVQPCLLYTSPSPRDS